MVAGTELTSVRSPRVAAARRLAKRAFRTADRRFLAEGPQAVREAVRAGVLREVFLTADAAARHPDVAAAIADAGVPAQRVSGEVVTVLSQTVTPQGIVGVCDFLDVPLEQALAGSPTLVAVLVNVRDPGNAGTVIRAADAAGANAVVLAGSSVDPYNGKCVRATAGSLFHLPVVAGPELAAATEAVHDRGLTVLAADGKGERDLDDVDADGELGRPTAWLFGNEAWGLPPEQRASADATVRIPMHGRAESLNLAAAAAVCLYASARAQRRDNGCLAGGARE